MPKKKQVGTTTTNGCHLLHNGLLLVEALLGARGQDATRGTAELPGDLLTLSLRSIFLYPLLLGTSALLDRPLGAFLLCGVALGDIHTLLLLDGLTLNDVILDLMLMVAGLTLGLIDGLTLLRTLTLANERGVAEPDRLIKGNLLVLNEAALLEVLIALLLLLRFEVSGICGVTPLRVAVVAFDLLVVLGLLNHHHLVNAALSSSSNGSNV